MAKRETVKLPPDFDQTLADLLKVKPPKRPSSARKKSKRKQKKSR
jgi:hypothetical protein